MIAFLRSRTGATLALLFAALLTGFGLVDRLERTMLPMTLAQQSEETLRDHLARAASLFATARALNSVVSVLQSFEVSGSVVVAQGTISPGQALDPVNDLVERFSAVMLTATVALGGSLLLVQAGDLFGLSVFLTSGLTLAALAPWIPGTVGAGVRRAGLILLVVAVVAKIGLPLAVLGTDAIAERLIEPQIVAAQTRLDAIDLPDLPTDPPAGDASLGAWAKGWTKGWQAMGDVTTQIGRMAAAAADLAETVIDLTVAYAIKIVVLPLVTLWLVARLAEVLIAGLLPRGSD